MLYTQGFSSKSSCIMITKTYFYYFEVLKRPSKFSVVFEETEDELNSLMPEKPPHEDEVVC